MRHCNVLLFGMLGACTSEVPPGEPHFAEDTGSVTLFQIQDVTAEGHPEIGAQVQIENLVVTAIDRFDEDGAGRLGTVFLQEVGGGPFSGIQMFSPVVLPAGEYLEPGDVVQAGGSYEEFEFGQVGARPDPEGRTVTQITDGVVRKTGEWAAPEPVVIDDPEVLALDPEAESWEGVLVELHQVVATANPDRYGSYAVTGGVQVEDDNYRIEGAAEGMHFERLAGVISYIYSYKILPRSSLDVVVEAE